MSVARTPVFLVMLWFVWLSVGCDETPELAVDLQTDLAPGIEFDGIEVSLDGLDRAQIEVSTSDRVDRPRRVMEEAGLAPGRHVIEVALRLGATRVVVRRVQFSLAGSRVVTVIITRDCREIGCPPTGTTECLAGRCVAPECTALGEAGCPEAECASNAECTASVACAAGACVQGVCIEVPVAGSCSALSVCVPERGCVGVAPTDAGESDAGTAPTDAWTLIDARLVGEDSAFLPELDAYVPPPSPEDCTLEGDENGDSLADCADPACAPLCETVGCRALRADELTVPSESIPTPSHWYRFDHQVISDGTRLDTVCAWRDLVGGAHFVVDESRFNLTRRVAGGVSFNQAGGQSRLVAHDSLGMEGATTTFFAWSHDPAAMPGGPLLFAYRPYRAPSWDGMTHFQLLYDTSSSGFVELRLWERDTDGARLRDSVPIAGLVSHTLAVEVGAPSVGTSLTGSFRYALDEAPFRGAAALRDVPLAALPESREAIAVIGDGQFQTVHEVLVYDRALTDPEIAVVREYLRLRYRP